jgi:hypothetical protein
MRPSRYYERERTQPLTMTVKPFGRIIYKTKEQVDEEAKRALEQAKAIPQASLMENVEEELDQTNDSFFF